MQPFLIRGLVSAVLLLLGSVTSQAAEVRASFDAGLDGFSISGDGTVLHQSVAGNGYLKLTDTNGGTDLYLEVPVTAGGVNWLPFLGGSLSFDAVMLNGIAPSWPGFGTVIFTSTSGQTALADIAPDVDGQITEPGLEWKTYSAPLSDAVFNQGSAPLSDVLASLGRISISMEAGNGPVEVVGFDNFVVSSAVPEPASWAMALLGLMGVSAVVAGRRQRR